MNIRGLIASCEDTDYRKRPIIPKELAALASRPEEVVITPSGEVRQAGADSCSSLIAQFRDLAEASLWFFERAILGLDQLNETLHLPVANWVQQCPPYRKLLLLPRDHLKSSLVAKGMSIHMLVQRKEANCYLAGKEGCNTRILLANETATNAQHFLRWIAAKLEGCELLKALWPHRVWVHPRKESRKWNENELLVPRNEDYPEASIETIGVGGAVAGRHYDVLIKDDLISLEAANSPPSMAAARQWHIASRALLDDPRRGLEFTVGTRWAVGDIYEDIEEDPSVDTVCHPAIEAGEVIFPEKFDLETLAQLKREQGPLFYLLYMLQPAGEGVSDFNMDHIRHWTASSDGKMTIEADERDETLKRHAEGGLLVQPGRVASTDLLAQLMKRGERLRYC